MFKRLKRVVIRWKIWRMIKSIFTPKNIEAAIRSAQMSGRTAGFVNGIEAVAKILRDAKINKVYFGPVTIKTDGNVTIKNCAFLDDDHITIIPNKTSKASKKKSKKGK